ncbi:MAG: class I SAM-dependent DNA methyltransferase [Solirubrobacteraceae bacterium]
MNILEFRAKWAGVGPHVTERAAAQEHFGDLCRVFGAPTPNEAHSGDYAFERAVGKLTGGRGFADVWRRGWWAWEYKRPGEDLDRAYQQLKLYADALENPPLLVTCDLTRFQVWTNFTATAVRRHELDLDALAEPAGFELMRTVFTEPLRLRPGQTKEEVTLEAAARFGALAAGMERRGVPSGAASHSLMQILFCLFAEDAGVLRKGLFSDLLDSGARRPAGFAARADAFFAAMRDGGHFGVQEIPHVNGGLFARAATPDLTAGELAALAATARLDWGGIEPAIFGTLFERSLDPAKRAQLGAHYTGARDIGRVVEPVVMAPLRRRWDVVRAEADASREGWLAERRGGRKAFADLLDGFRGEIAAVRVLDPACGSGNFLYVTLAKLLDLEQTVSAYGAHNGLPFALPRVRAVQMLGLEINATARELAQVAVWIGYLQWMIEHGYGFAEPVLEPLETIRLQDALLDLSDPAGPREAAWPEVDFIIGNPPFLGGKRLRSELGDAMVHDLFAVYDGRVPREADLVCYFFEKARGQIAEGKATRAGLLATNSIRGGANRRVLERIKAGGDIFAAWDDEPWILDGAAVRISIVAFDDGTEADRTFDGAPVPTINADLTAAIDTTAAKRLPENLGIAFMGDTKGGPFDVPGDLARRWLALPVNANGRPNGDVVRPWVNGLDVTRRPRDMWIVDFGIDMPEREAALYEAPFEHVREHVKPLRDTNNRETYRDRWWLHVEARSGLRTALDGLNRFICTGRVSKHRLFTWLPETTLPDSATIAFARQDNYFFGVLHSRAHEAWSLRMGTWLGVGNDPRYTPTTCFETFPLPWPPGREPWRDPLAHAIAQAAEALDDHRRIWLDAAGATEAERRRRTLTNLYNERPSWLSNDHAALDRAVWAAYGWDDPEPAATLDEAILARLLALNRERAPLPSGADVRDHVPDPSPLETG